MTTLHAPRQLSTRPVAGQPPPNGRAALGVLSMSRFAGGAR